MVTNRRSFLIGIGAVLATPAIVRADSLMKLWVPRRTTYFLDHDGFKMVDVYGNAAIDVGGPSLCPSVWLIQWGPSIAEQVYPGSPA